MKGSQGIKGARGRKVNERESLRLPKMRPRGRMRSETERECVRKMKDYREAKAGESGEAEGGKRLAERLIMGEKR